MLICLLVPTHWISAFRFHHFLLWIPENVPNVQDSMPLFQQKWKFKQVMCPFGEMCKIFVEIDAKIFVEIEKEIRFFSLYFIHFIL